MYIQEALVRAYARRMVSFGVVVFGGCGVSMTPGTSDPPRPTLNLAALDLDDESAYLESAPNDFLDLAEPVDITASRRAILGFIDSSSDVDVYDLGPVAAGERIVVTMTAADSLDGAIALFDGTGAALLINDHRNVYLGQAEPFIDVVVRRPSDACYVVVSATPGFNSFGEYALTASKEYPVPLPEPRRDVILLVFDGADNVVIGSRAPVNVGVFDAADIWSGYAGRSEAMMREVVDRVRRDYDGFDVTILSTSEGDTLQSGSAAEPGMSRIFFGTYDPTLLGVAEGVDEFNATTDQEAIVFTDTFAAFLPLEPSLFEMSQALANVASHEIGHLLGMVHTKDPLGIMDVTASLNELIEDQVFTRSPIFSLVFPRGDQDAPQYLLDAVGGDRRAAPQGRSAAPSDLLFVKNTLSRARTLAAAYDRNVPPARDALSLSTCCLSPH